MKINAEQHFIFIFTFIMYQNKFKLYYLLLLCSIIIAYILNRYYIAA